MLAKRVGELPVGGTWIFEPKWDGFRALVFRDGEYITETAEVRFDEGLRFCGSVDLPTMQLLARCDGCRTLVAQCYPELVDK